MTKENNTSTRPVIPCENPDLAMRFRIFREHIKRAFIKKKAYGVHDKELLSFFQDQGRTLEMQCDYLVRYVAEAFDHYALWDYTHAYYPGRPSQQTARMDAMEGASRVLPVLAAWLHHQQHRSCEERGEMNVLDGRKLDISGMLKSAFLAGTDSRHPGYWGDLKSYDQRVCECADLALALWLSRNWVWSELAGSERSQIIKWFSQVNGLSTADNNWHLFPLMVQVVINSLTGLDCIDHEKYQRVKEFYTGDGWFRDGCRGNFDYYNAWGFHYSLYWLDQVNPGFDREFIRQTMSEFLGGYRYLLTPAGFPFFGRSACYRLAVTVPHLAAIDQGTSVITPGEANRALSTSIQYFISHGAMSCGAPTQGLFSSDHRLVDNYSGPGSSFWSLRSLVIAFYSGHRSGLWDSAPEPLPIEKGDFQVDIQAIEAKVFGFQNTGEVVFVFSSDYTQEHSPETRRLEAQSALSCCIEIMTGRADRPKNNLLRKGVTCYSSKMTDFAKSSFFFTKY